MKTKPRSLCVFLFFGVLLLCSTRSGFAHARFTTDGPVSESAVLNCIHHANQLEIKLGGLAQQNAGSQAVRDYGAALVKEHTAADKKVIEVSREDGVALEAKLMSQDEEDTWNHLSTIRGAAFDQGFNEAMEVGHKEIIDVLDYDLGQLPESRTQSLVSALLPKLRKHAALAKHLLAQERPVKRE